MRSRGWVTAAVAAVLTLSVATAASADAQQSYYKQCDLPGWFTHDPLVMTAWADTGPNYWTPTIVRVKCRAVGCSKISSVLVSVFDSSTGTYEGAIRWTMPAGWTNGDLRFPSWFDGVVKKGHSKMTVVTVKRPNGQYCTVVNDQFLPRDR